ncbi:MAG: hypothetical protein J7L47_07335 [Candidatus Odinarchaeota archaeon]|nr:hypothetical protein [Candidatus Odinarchaeota archaeon]
MAPCNSKKSEFKSDIIDDIFLRFKMRKGPIAEKIMRVMIDGRPHTTGEIARITKIKSKKIHDSIKALFQRGVILRSKEYFKANNRINKGRAGIRYNNRWYYLWKLNDGVYFVDGVKFVEYTNARKDPRGRKNSVAKRILEFLQKNKDNAFFSNEIATALQIPTSYVMCNIRRLEKKGFVYVRGYRNGDTETPFQNGYLITYVSPDMPREAALSDAIKRTDKRLDEADTNILRYIRRVRDIIFADSSNGRLTSLAFLINRLNLSRDRVHTYTERALQLYSELRKIKLFGLYTYFYHKSIPDLDKAVANEKKYLKAIGGRANRVGHNYEAVVGWFVDKFTTGAKFWVQNHRTNMDKRRITVHLIKPVREGTRNKGEFDRVWDVQPSPFSPRITYVLECKYGIIRKRDVDIFFEKMRWSKEFGANTENGRVLRQGVVGLFAGNTFNPHEKVVIDGNELSLSQYAARLNITLIRSADLNERLHKHGVPTSVSVQKICRYCKDEKEVEQVLNAIWDNPTKAEDILKEVLERNQEIFEFERQLEQKK